MRTGILAAGLFAVLMISATASAQAAKPGGTKSSSHESSAASTAPANMIHRARGSDLHGSRSVDKQVVGRASATQVVLSLAIVVGLILLTYFIVRRVLPGGAGNALRAFRNSSPQPIRVISRVAIASKQRLLVLQVGRRLLVVADNGQQLGTLCEISDAEEAEELIGQLDARRTSSERRTVNSSFAKAHLRWPVMRSMSAGDGEPDELAQAQEEIDGLLHRVRGVARQARRAS